MQGWELVLIELHPAVRQTYSVSSTSPSVFLTYLSPCMSFCFPLLSVATVTIHLLLYCTTTDIWVVLNFSFFSVKTCRQVYTLELARVNTHLHWDLLIALQLFPLSFSCFTSDRWAEVCVSYKNCVRDWWTSAGQGVLCVWVCLSIHVCVYKRKVCST